MRESDLRRLIQRSLPEVHWQSIETGGTGLGVPDLNGCFVGREFWVELKLVRAGLRACLSPTQVAWHQRRCRAGGVTWFFIRWRDAYHLYRGGRAADLHEQGLALAPEASWPVTRTPWAEVLERMTS